MPYKGEGPACTDLVGGAIQFMVGNIAAAAPFVANGRLKALGVTSTERSPLLPECADRGRERLAGFENIGWFGFMVPAGTAADDRRQVHRDTVRVLDKTGLKARLFEQLGMEAVGNSPADFAGAIEAESQRWAEWSRQEPQALTRTEPTGNSTRTRRPA